MTACLFVTWSCTDLDETIYREIIAENYYQNEDEIRAAMMRPFVQNTQSISGFLKNVWILQELSADIVCFPQKALMVTMEETGSGSTGANTQPMKGVVTIHGINCMQV